MWEIILLSGSLVWGIYLHFRDKRDKSTEKMMERFVNGFVLRSDQVKLQRNPGNLEMNIFGTFGIDDETFANEVIFTGDTQDVDLNKIYRKKMLEDKMSNYYTETGVIQFLKILLIYTKTCWLYGRFKRIDRIRRGL